MFKIVEASLDTSNGIYLITLFLRPHQLTIFLKSLQNKAGLNQIGELSGHSFRVATLDLLNKNIPL
jgi:hypothetical protein